MGPADEQPVSVQQLVELWSRIRGDVKLQNRRIEALLAEVDPVQVSGTMVTLRAAYPFHRNRLEEDDVREVVQAAISRRTGSPLRVRTILKGEEDDGASLRLVPAATTGASPAIPPSPPDLEPSEPSSEPSEPPATLEVAPDPLPATSSTGSATVTPSPPTEPGPSEPAVARGTESAGTSPTFRPEDDDAIVRAARTIFDGEDIPDPLGPEVGRQD